MPSQPPDGSPSPADESLPDAARAEVGSRPLGFYLHVPYCTTRCGYCDFNTYTSAELGSEPGTGQDSYLAAMLAEIELAGRVLGDAAPPVGTIFVGGGTPTLLPPESLITMITAIKDRFGLLPDAEITTESNPESIGPDGLERLRDGGFNRISFGMQSAVEQVLATLDRVHSPGRAGRTVAEARAAGFDDVSLDLIFGTPGESLADWRTSLETALAAEPDHVSAYALIVETGTRLATRIRRGELAQPDDDDLADKYLLAEELLTGAGLSAYEISNWARTPAHRCRHNLGYWRGDHWWGVGPGAHSHVGGVRWWNVRHPAAYTGRLAAGEAPAQARELLDDHDRRVERVLLELRLADGLDPDTLTASESSRVADLVDRELIVITDGRLVLTLRGRLLADGVVRDLLD
ncbi:radical SAM family heme chaperone HemW [Microlunatus sp. GCM10028923]|uniref:radical SAM family heme chaperone HemW n=1 Tax=Microlunatus sp. GCM10028923 TaxID=3273400 RepID=UPI00360FF41A